MRGTRYSENIYIQRCLHTCSWLSVFITFYSLFLCLYIYKNIASFIYFPRLKCNEVKKKSTMKDRLLYTHRFLGRGETAIFRIIFESFFNVDRIEVVLLVLTNRCFYAVGSIHIHVPARVYNSLTHTRAYSHTHLYVCK